MAKCVYATKSTHSRSPLCCFITHLGFHGHCRQAPNTYEWRQDTRPGKVHSVVEASDIKMYETNMKIHTCKLENQRKWLHIDISGVTPVFPMLALLSGTVSYFPFIKPHQPVLSNITHNLFAHTLKEHVALDRPSWSLKSICNRLLYM